MATVTLKNIKKIYPYNADEAKKRAKKAKKKGAEPEKKVNLQITDEGVVAVQEFNLEIQFGIRPDLITLGDEGVGATIDVSEMMGSSVHLHVNAGGKDVIIVVSAMNMTGAEVAALKGGVAVKFNYGGNNCHVFSRKPASTWKLPSKPQHSELISAGITLTSSEVFPPFLLKSAGPQMWPRAYR